MHQRQSGVITVAAVMLLIAGVLLILTQSAGLLRSRGYDTSQDLAGVKALALAESGIQRTEYQARTTQESGGLSATACSAFADGNTYSLGDGTFTVDSATALPTGCAAGTCDSCSVQVTGKVGDVRRVLNSMISLSTVYGTTGRGTTVTMVLKNTYSVPAIALFELAWRRQGTNGNSNGTSSTTAGTLTWNVESSSGNPSVGSIGTAVSVPANTTSQSVTQVLDYSRDYVEVGVLYPSTTSAAPKVLKSYWSNQGSYQTAPNSGTTGAVKTGFNKNDTTPCTPVPNPASGGGGSTTQACQTWCYDSTVGDVGAADTLIYGIAARSTTVADSLTAVVFNGYSMSNMVHFPATDGSIAAASGAVYAEQWHMYNAPYTSADVASTSVGATTYDAAIFGVSGTDSSLSFSGVANRINNNSTSGTVTAVVGKYCVGDYITAGNLQSNTTITTVITGGVPNTTIGTCFTATGNGITISKSSTGNVTSATLPSPIVSVTSSTPTTLSMGSANVLNTTTGAVTAVTITAYDSTTTPPTYTLTPPPSTPINGFVVQGTGLSTTVRLPSGTTAFPALGTESTPQYPIVQVHSAQRGGFATNTRVTAVDTGAFTFTVSTAPTTAIIGGKICGGVCGFFTTPGTNNASTSFSITRSSGTNQWGGGMLCLAGVDKAKIIPISNTSVTRRTWWESQQ